MKKTIFLALSLLIATTSYATSSLFEQGNAKYKEGDFKGAMQAYQQHLAAGNATAAVYFNLGNAALKAGEKGQALVYYERARRAAPRDKDLLWNIQVLKSALKDKIEDPSHFVLAATRRFLEKLSVDEAALCLAVFLALFAGLSVMGSLLPSFKRTSGPLFAVVWIGLFASLVLFGAKWWETRNPLVVVLDQEVYAHYGPSESETKAFLLHEGAEGRKEDESGDWIFLSLADSHSGWIRKDTSETV